MHRNKNIPKIISKRIAPKRESFRGVFRSLFNTSMHTQEEVTSQRAKPKKGSKNKNVKQRESYYRDKLAKKLNGRTEVVTRAGKIDILTNNEIIEVKYIKKWKEALGQLISYGKYYPSHRKRIHLFGGKHNVDSCEIENTCTSNGVSVSWEEDEIN